MKPSFDRIEGSISREDKERITKKLREVFENQSFEELEKMELEKTPDEIELLRLVNKATNEVRRKYGLGDFDVLEKNFHVVEKNTLSQRPGTPAFFNMLAQGVVIERANKLQFTKLALHEALHFKSYHALQVTDEEKPELSDYRMGWVINSRDGKFMRFSSINEAVTEELTKRIALRLFEAPLLKKEAECSKDVMKKYPDAVTDEGEPLYSEDTFYAEERPDNRMIVIDFVYTKERKMLKTLIHKLCKKNPEILHQDEDAYELFFKAMITGNILPLGKIIEKTFGKGTFRKLGDLDADVDEQLEFVESL